MSTEWAGDYVRLPAKPGEELWNIRASIEDAKNNLEPFLSALTSACIDYIGQNSGKELHFKRPELSSTDDAEFTMLP